MRIGQSISPASKSLVALGGVMIGVGGAGPAFLPAFTTSALVFAGLAFSVLGLVLGAGNVATYLHREIRNGVSRHEKTLLRIFEYRARNATSEDFADVIALLDTNFRTYNEAAAAALSARLAVNPESLVVVERHRGADRYLAGCFILYLLKPEACERVICSSIVSGHGLLPADLSAGPETSSGLYVGTIAGRATGLDRAATLFYCGVAIRDRLHRGTGIRWLFTRPATEHGKRLARDLSLTPVDQRRSDIWMVDGDHVRRLLGGPATARS